MRETLEKKRTLVQKLNQKRQQVERRNLSSLILSSLTAHRYRR
jgi:hypothetical protein